jgi:predicted SAM-dependent methyltransferase
VTPTSRWLNVGCGPHRVEGWWNTDRVSCCHHHPDEVVWDDDPFPYADGTFDRAYLGHVLEHVPWDWRLTKLLAELQRVLTPSAEVCAVGPDVRRTIDAYAGKSGHRPGWQAVEAAMEWPYDHMPDSDHHGFAHAWNCTEDRLVRLMLWAGFVDVEPVALKDRRLDRWPLSGRSPLQCAVLARRP